MTEAEMETLRRLAAKWDADADAARKKTRTYDGGAWDFKAEAYERCAEELLDALSQAPGDKAPTRGSDET